MTNAKELLGEMITKLNKAGFTGGFYHYKPGECSCCDGLENVDFQINENKPDNWMGGENTHKITYQTKDKARATQFRKIANKLVRKYFGRMAETAKSNFRAITITL